jgi:hypothetical protein
MEIVAIISIVAAVVLGVLLWDRRRENRKLSEDLKWQQAANMQLLKNQPVKSEDRHAEAPEPLTVSKIADAVRMEGFFPESDETGVKFKAQGESFYIDAERLPLVFILKSYNVDPNEWEMDILRDAAHLMSDALIMVKATFTDDDRTLNFFVAAQDRNYESFRANLTNYMRIIEDGQRKMNEEYHCMVDEKREAAIAAQPVVPPARTDTKVMS